MSSSPESPRLSRRDLIFGGLSMVALSCAKVKTTPNEDVYFRNYTLSGLFAVAQETTVPSEQQLAATLLRKRMYSFGYDNLAMTSGGLGTYVRKVNIVDAIGRNPGVAFAIRDSPLYAAAMQTQPSNSRLQVEYFGLLPNVLSSIDGGSLEAIGISFPPGTVLLQSRYGEDPIEWRLFAGMLAHENGHLEVPEYRLLESEIYASRKEIIALRALRNKGPTEPIDERIAYASRVIRNGRYLRDLSDFSDVYPAEISMKALEDAGISDEILRKYAELNTRNEDDVLLRNAAIELLNSRTEHQVGSVTSHPKSEPTPNVIRIPDVPNGDIVRRL